jgi:hypothetical protein
VVRQMSELRRGFLPVTRCFREERGEHVVHWYCHFCPYSYYEPEVSAGWPLSMSGLLQLAKHAKTHTDAH